MLERPDVSQKPPCLLVDIKSTGKKMLQFTGIVGLDFVRQSLKDRLTSRELEKNLQAVNQIEETVTNLFTNGGLMKPKGGQIHFGIEDIPLPVPLKEDLKKQAVICSQVNKLIEEYGFDPRSLPDFSTLTENNWVFLIGKNLRQLLFYIKTPGNSLDFNYVPVNQTAIQFSPHDNLDRITLTLEKHFSHQQLLVTPKNIIERTYLDLITKI